MASSGKQLLKLGWDGYIQQCRKRPCLHPHLDHLPHPAGPLLQQLRHDGAPLQLTTPPWTSDQLEAASQRGSHQSAHSYLGFLEQEMLDMVRRGYWTILPYNLVKDTPNLRLSPIGVVPQRERRPRTIVDYTFHHVNHDTRKLAPPESMQFGQALDRLLYRIWSADPKFGPVYALKVDLSDGFYRIHTQTWASSSQPPQANPKQ